MPVWCSLAIQGRPTSERIALGGHQSPSACRQQQQRRRVQRQRHRHRSRGAAVLQPFVRPVCQYDSVHKGVEQLGIDVRCLCCRSRQRPPVASPSRLDPQISGSCSIVIPYTPLARCAACSSIIGLHIISTACCIHVYAARFALSPPRPASIPEAPQRASPATAAQAAPINLSDS